MTDKGTELDRLAQQAREGRLSHLNRTELYQIVIELGAGFADCRAELEQHRRDWVTAAESLSSHAEREAKWCSYCGVNTHNDAECWSTRPADWSKERYPDAFKFPPTIIDTSSVGGVAPSPAGPDALAEELERVKARYEALLANFRGRCLYCSSCDHIQDCMANLGCLNVPIACGMSKIEADAALSRKRWRK